MAPHRPRRVNYDPLTLADEIEAALKGATPGPWTHIYDAGEIVAFKVGSNSKYIPIAAVEFDRARSDAEHVANAKSIALLRNRALDIVEMLRSQAKEIKRLAFACDEAVQFLSDADQKIAELKSAGNADTESDPLKTAVLAWASHQEHKGDLLEEKNAGERLLSEIRKRWP